MAASLVPVLAPDPRGPRPPRRRSWAGVCLLALVACGEGGGSGPSSAATGGSEATGDPGRSGRMAASGVDPLDAAHLAGIDAELEELLRAAQDDVRAAPDDPQAWYALGLLFESGRMRSRALACYLAAREERPDDPKLWYRTAIVRWRLGRFEQAVADLERSIELEPGYAASYYRRGVVQLDRGDLEAAERSFREGTERHPAYVGSWLGLARVQLQLDRTAEALAGLEDLARDHPDDVKVNNLLVTAYRQAGRTTERETLETPYLGDTPDPSWGDPWHEELMAVRPGDLRGRARVLLQPGGDPDAAIALLEAHREAHPEDDELDPMLAEAYFQAERTKDAARTLREYGKRHPADVRSRFQLAGYQHRLGEPHAAVRWLDEILGIDLEHAEAWLMKGAILYEEEQFERAIPVISRGYALDQRRPDPLLWLGMSHMALQQWEPARERLRAYLEREPDSAGAWLALARACWKLELADEARAALDRAVAQGIDRPAQVERLSAGIDALRAGDSEGEE